MLLQFPVMRFRPDQIEGIATAFAETIQVRRYTCYACAIMPDHVHLVIRKHRDTAEQMIENFQNDSRLYLQSRGSVSADHPVWTKGGWKVFLDTPGEVWPRIHYVEGNPMKEGLPREEWPFVVPYNNWPYHKKLRS